MPKTRSRYPAAFKQQIVELAMVVARHEHGMGGALRPTHPQSWRYVAIAGGGMSLRWSSGSSRASAAYEGHVLNAKVIVNEFDC